MKVRTDEAGIKVTWNRDTELRTVVRQHARKRTLAAALVAIFAYIAFGHWLVYAVAAVALLLLLAALVFVAREAREIRKHPPLDYSLIASMERPIWGEAFEHAGAPATKAARQDVTEARIMEMRRANYRPAEIAAELGLDAHTIRGIVENRTLAGAVSRTACIRCGAPQPVARGRCSDCYREWRRRNRRA